MGRCQGCIKKAYKQTSEQTASQLSTESVLNGKWGSGYSCMKSTVHYTVIVCYMQGSRSFEQWAKPDPSGMPICSTRLFPLNHTCPSNLSHQGWICYSLQIWAVFCFVLFKAACTLLSSPSQKLFNMYAYQGPATAVLPVFASLIFWTSCWMCTEIVGRRTHCCWMPSTHSTHLWNVHTHTPLYAVPGQQWDRKQEKAALYIF